jgi:hypothetical protein
MRLSLLLAVSLALAATHPVPTGVADDVRKEGIGVELRTTTPVVRNGEMPRFRVEVVNHSDAAVTLVKPGDGSDCGCRTPVVAWVVEGVTPGRVGRCGNINALRADEIFTLRPGQRVRLGKWVGFPNLPGPGRYKIRFRYENRPDLKWSGVPLGPHDAKAMPRVRASTPAVAYSNAVTVEVAGDKAK